MKMQHIQPLLSAPNGKNRPLFLRQLEKKDEELKKFDEAAIKLEEALVIRSAKSDKKNDSRQNKK